MSWLTAPISDFAILNSGYAFKSANWTDSGIPVVKITNVKSGGVNLSGCGWVAEETVKGLDRYRLNIGDLLITMTGDVGDIGLVRDDAAGAYLNQRVGRFKIIDPRLSKDFLRFCLQLPDLRDTFRAVAYGAAQPNISPTLILAQEIPLPPLPTQRKIASILSAYDDLIENNTRRVRVLEEMARALYREWFVEYRFPGHEQAEFVEDEQGRRPAGWERTTLGQSFITILGGTPSRAKPEFWGGDVPWLNSGKANDLRVVEPSEYITAEGYKKSAAKMMPAGATIIAITGATLGQVSRIEIRACGNQSLVGLWGYEDHQNTFVYLATKLSWISQIVAKAGGGAQQHVNKDKINETEVLLPPDDILKAFDGQARPLFDLVRSFLLRNANLRRTRDLLLARLVSGELDVSDLEIAGVEAEA